MSDIVLELRFYGAKRKWPKGIDGMDGLLNTAAHEITRLRTALSETERRARREALEEAATLAEGSAKTFNFQEALANGDDIEVGAKSVQLSIATAIRALIPSEPHDAEGRE